jgi:hypothetical protein
MTDKEQLMLAIELRHAYQTKPTDEDVELLEEIAEEAKLEGAKFGELRLRAIRVIARNLREYL